MFQITRRILLAAGILLLAYGCTDRGTNIVDRPTSVGGVLNDGHDFFPELLLQLGRNVGQTDSLTRVPLQLRSYAPEGSWSPISGGQPRRVPLLILLAPQDGDEYYFFNHGLKELADELIATGTIQPMYIVCVPSDPIFGGYFYAGLSAPAGYYDTLIPYSLAERLVTSSGGAVDLSLPVGIGGIGMGGYGAFRAALLRKDFFTSISVTDGPYDFDGPLGMTGFVSLFDEALREQGLLNADGWKTQFDSSGAWHLSRLFIGGGLAFSPHDTFVDTVGITEVLDLARTKLRIQIASSKRFTFDDSTTLISGIVRSARPELDFDFHLPFDSTGQLYVPIWSRWMRNNLDSLLAEHADALDGIKVWIATSPEYEFGNYREQTLSWIQTLQMYATADLSVKEYTGAPGSPARDDRYVYELLRDILIFHSRAFEEAN